MTEPDQIVLDILAAADGELIGRVRLQKVAYLLEQAGVRSGLRFRYHHYGPYSEDLDAALDRAKAFSGVKEQIQYRQSDGMPYSIFRRETEGATPRKLGRLPFRDARALVSMLKEKSATVLELAATIHWLVVKERIADWRPELERRKGPKTRGGRVEEALALLREIDLAPA